MTGLSKLLDLQALDTRLDQLDHRRDNLPEDAEIAELSNSLAAIETRRAEIAAERHELTRNQQRLEDEVAGIEAKRADDTDKMYNGGITSPKELSALQDELDSLARRQEQLEDQVIELMEQGEPLDSTLAKFDAKSAELEADRGRLEASRTVALAEIGAEHASVEAEREGVAAEMNEALLAKYERMRGGAKGGVAVGQLTAGTCSACGLGVSAVFADRARNLADDEIVNCEECGVILVPVAASAGDGGNGSSDD